jgi:hypothetical protein
MKTIKIMMMVLALSVISQFASAQNCPGGKVLMSKGSSGCGCQCHKKCVSPGDVQTYLNNGWSYGDCYFRCCFGTGWRIGEEKDITESSLTDIYPNPVSGSSTIFFSLSEAQQVSFKLFDMTGRLVVTIQDENFGEGENEFIWDASTVNTGIYILQMQTGSFSETKRVSVIK